MNRNMKENLTDSSAREGGAHEGKVTHNKLSCGLSETSSNE